MPEKKPCCAWKCCGLLCILPVGGALALFASIFGIIFLTDGFDELLDALKKMGANLDKYNIDVYVDYIGYAVIFANALVTLYGLREKARTRLNLFGHIQSPLAWIIKFFLKTLIHIIVCGSFVFATILMFLLEAIYVLFLSIDASCDATGDTVQDIVDIFSDKSGTVDDICDAMKTGKEGALSSFIGSMIITLSQVIAIAYWYKYSTLAMVPAFYTTGKYSKDYETKAEKRKREEEEHIRNSMAPDSEAASEVEMGEEDSDDKAPVKL